MKRAFDLRVKLPPAQLSTTHGESFTPFLFILTSSRDRSCEYIFMIASLALQGAESESVLVADAPFTRPLIGMCDGYHNNTFV